MGKGRLQCDRRVNPVTKGGERETPYPIPGVFYQRFSQQGGNAGFELSDQDSEARGSAYHPPKECFEKIVFLKK
jgi:hypothetical protein